MEPSEKDMIEELQKTVDELKECLRLKEQRIGELEGYTQSLERQQEASEAHIKSLDETIARQDELMAEQQSFSKDFRRGEQDEVDMLKEILEAQERSLEEQRGIIEEQSALIADLSRHMQDDDEDQPVSEDLKQASSSRGPSPKVGPRPNRCDPNSMPVSRLSPREMLLKKPAGGGNAGAPQPVPQAVGGGPPRPRPNSAFGKDAPRAKSWGAGGGRDRNGQEAEIVRRAGPKQPTTCTAQAGGRTSGRRYPPALPILEQRA